MAVDLTPIFKSSILTELKLGSAYTLGFRVDTIRLVGYFLAIYRGFWYNLLDNMRA